MSDAVDIPFVIVVTGDLGETIIPSRIANRMARLNAAGRFDRRYRTAARDQRLSDYLLRKLSVF